MKKTILIVLVLFAVIAMATTKVMGQDIDIETISFSFSNEIGCEIRYETVVLADIIATSIELDDEDEAIRLLSDYDGEFQSELGQDEPAVAILVPDDDFFNVIFLQEDENGEIITLRILTESGWLVCDAMPGEEVLLHLAGMIYFIQHLNEVSDN